MARISLNDYKIPGSSEAFYIPDFVTEDEEDYLVRKQKWKQLANRRLQLLGGELSAKNVLVAQPMPAFLTSYPQVIQRIQDTGAFSDSPHAAPNHVILNEYLPGQGIMPHEDGPAYHPVVTTISLGSHAVFHYYKYKTDSDDRSIDSNPVLSVLLEPRSAIITTGSLYKEHLHGIQDVEEDEIITGNEGPQVSIGEFRSTIANWQLLRSKIPEGGTLKRSVRYSLTCRDVERVLNGRTLPFLKR